MSARSRRLFPVLAVGLLLACDPGPPETLPPHAFAFGVFGDGPYHPWEQGRFRRVLDDVERGDVEWLIHVGDILWYPCSEEAYRERRAQLDGTSVAVVYTPGDNEWTDCHEERPGRYDPLDRLAALRRTFFADPYRSLGSAPMALVSQARDTAYAEFVENARWSRGGFVFATVHVVGSSNGLDPFVGRTPDHDAEVVRRTRAAVAWIRESFDVARGDSATGVVLALHAELGLPPAEPGRGYEDVVAELERQATRFDGAILLIHGDDHELTVNHPLTDSAGRTLQRFTRLETYGSPDIGWVRVVVDTLTGALTTEPRLMRGWW